MSQASVTIPLMVPDINPSSVSLKYASMSDFGADEDTAQYHYEHDFENPRSAGNFDPWKLRDDFLTWPLEEWGGFIHMAGTLGGFRITRKDFGEWQELLTKVLLLPTREWKSLAGEFDSRKVSKLQGPLPIYFDWEAEPPTAKLLGLTTLGTLIAATQLDKLQGAEFRVCARSDCMSPPFRVGAHHKIYCDTPCAHLVAVREARKRKANGTAAKSAKSKEAKNGSKQ